MNNSCCSCNCKFLNGLCRVFLIGIGCFFLLALGSVGYLKYTKRPDLSLVGPVIMADGVGRQSYDYYKLLSPHGEVNLLTTSCKKNGLSWEEWAQFWNPIKPLGDVVMVHHCLSRNPKKRELFSVLNPYARNIGNELAMRTTWNPKEQILIPYSMFESDEILPMWVEQINIFCDAVAVPDPFLVDVYRNCGVKKPIFFLPLGIHYPKTTPKVREVREFTAEKPCIFGNLASTDDRKNTFKTVAGFYEAFGNDPNVHLRINSRTSQPREQDKIDQFFKEHSEITNITITHRCLSREEFLEELDSFDVYISISQGEGFSIIPREAMERGIPVIVSDATAQSTIAKSGLVRSVPCPLRIPAYYFFSDQPIGHYPDCEVSEVAHAYRDLYQNYSHYFSRNNAARQWALQYSYENLLPLYSNFLLHPKKLILGERNEVTPEYIMTTSPELLAKYEKIMERKINANFGMVQRRVAG